MADGSAPEGEATDKRVLDRDGEPIFGATLNEDGSVSLALEAPVPVIGEPRDTLTFKKPTVGDLGTLDRAKGAMAATVSILAKSANVPPTAIEALDIADFVAAGKILVFFQSKRKGGAGL